MKKTYIFMLRDECGDEYRAYGSDFLEAEHTFQLDAPEDIAEEVLFGWLLSMESAAQREWEEKYGCECRLFMEETSQSIRENLTSYEQAILFDESPFEGWDGEEIAELISSMSEEQILKTYGRDFLEGDVEFLKQEYPEYWA